MFEIPQTETNYNLLTLFQFPIAPTTFVDCELSLGNAVAHSGACFVPYGAPTRFNMHFDGPAEVLPPIQFSCAPAPCCLMCSALCASACTAAARPSALTHTCAMCMLKPRVLVRPHTSCMERPPDCLPPIQFSCAPLPVIVCRGLACA